ncbi:NAD(P)-binding protein [Martensiomyces pterosporus]|nr:NAD(P)-binding protein [Martensiomyces pterosporus]
MAAAPGGYDGIPIGANVDTVLGMLSVLVSSPVAAFLVGVHAYIWNALTSAWFMLYLAVFLAKAFVSWLKHDGGLRRKIKWDRQVVLLTGGAHGVGLCLLRRLSKTGARIAVLDIADLPEPKLSNVYFYKCNLADTRQLPSIVEKIENDLGAVTVLVNNAGTLCPKLVSEQEFEDSERVINVNFAAPVQLTRMLLPGMLRSPHAHIVFVASTLSFIGVPQLATYTATKAAIALFQDSLKLELRSRLGAHRVHTTALFPSKISSGMFSGTEVPEWLSPVLSPDFVAENIFGALDEARDGEIYLPAYANLTPVYMVLPQLGRAFAHWVAGSLDSMRTFKGYTHGSD